MISRKATVPADGALLTGELVTPGPVRSVVLFAYDSSGSRHRPRNRTVAAALRRAGSGTLLLDLLTEREEREDALTVEHRFDIPLLARRLVAAIDWLDEGPDASGLPVGLFGAGTVAAAALVAAAERPERVYAVAAWEGRPDLAGDALERVRAPVLLIAGGDDGTVVRLNRAAAERLPAPHRVLVVNGARYLFEKPEALAQVTDAVSDWFVSSAASRQATV
ncbi:dienelactone hydrolase family protein [Streptomyces sp. NPDC058664]|uniref:dienelactone hydrolase family protein n=1 Tax=unclassified Streptomyces TaxID=2593676 RepID=UPI00364D8AE6